VIPPDTKAGRDRPDEQLPALHQKPAIVKSSTVLLIYDKLFILFD
jgi:hypothetical protein